MTRDEAFKIVKPMYGGGTDEILDIWQSLGVLKLDEPKSPETEFLDEMSGRLPCFYFLIMRDALKRRDLKIVKGERL